MASTRSRIVANQQTGDAVQAALIWTFPDGTTGADVPVPVASVVKIYLEIDAVQNGNVTSRFIRAVAKRGAGALSVVGAPDALAFNDAAAAAWLVNFSQGSVQGTFNVKVTGVAATVIQWDAGLEYKIFTP